MTPFCFYPQRHRCTSRLVQPIIIPKRLRGMGIEFIDYVHRDSNQTEVLWAQMDETLALLPYPLLPGFTRQQSRAPMALSLLPIVPKLLSIGAAKSDRIAITNTGPGYLGYNAWHFLRTRGKKTAYLCDVWPVKFPLLKRLAKGLGLNPVFVSYRQSAEELDRQDQSRRYLYVPEGLPAGHYPADPYHEREWDLVTFGRKWVDLHNKIKAGMEGAQIRYLFRDDGRPVAETHQELMATLGRTRISVCAPRGVTQPGLSGGVEAMTLRYLQSIACKCLVYGRAPEEMVDLFGYNPVIEADLNDPVGQLREILDRFDEHIPLIERNYQTLLGGHLWSHRVVEIARILREQFGWEIAQPVFHAPATLDRRTP